MYEGMWRIIPANDSAAHSPRCLGAPMFYTFWSVYFGVVCFVGWCVHIDS